MERGAEVMANPSSTSSKRLVGLGLRGMRNVSLLLKSCLSQQMTNSFL